MSVTLKEIFGKEKALMKIFYRRQNIRIWYFSLVQEFHG